MQYKYQAIFGRVTTSGEYVPVVDGVRFLAIIWVMLFHCERYFREKFPEASSSANTVISAIAWFMSLGNVGVPIFFVLSGFILSKSFESLRGRSRRPCYDFYIRRLTRLEPPYIASLLLLAIAAVITGKLTLSRDLLLSLAASVVYLHDIIFSTWSPVNGVAWSLEVETQFYLIFPLIFFVSTHFSPRFKRMALISGILTFSLFSVFYPFDRRTLLQFFQYFIAGMLFFNIQRENTRRIDLPRWLGRILFILLVLVIGAAGWNSSIWGGLLAPWLILGLFFVVFGCPVVRQILSGQVISLVGGMCYSIYLLHYPFISLFGRLIPKQVMTLYPNLAFVPAIMAMVVPTIACSSVFYLLVERPTMRPSWVKELPFLRKKGGFREAGNA